MAPKGRFRRIDKTTPIHSGTDLRALCIYFIHIVDFVGLEFEPSGQERLNVKGVFGVRIGCELKIGVLGDVVLVRKERPHTTQLEDTLAAVHDGQFVLAHKLFTTMSSDEFKMGKKIPLLIMRRGIKCDIQKLDSQLLNNIA